jgi:prepilin-type processing-associated H-X9-DG protein
MSPFYTSVVPTYVCPSDPRENAGAALAGDAFGETNYAQTDYLGVLGKNDKVNNDGVFGGYGHAGDYLNGDFDHVTFSMITDGLSNTVMVGERPPPQTSNGEGFGWSVWGGWFIGQEVITSLFTIVNDPGFLWYEDGLRPCPAPTFFEPGDLSTSCHGNHFWSFHPGGGNWLLCDGSVRFMSYTAGTTVIPDMAIIAGGEVIPPLD